ncbi:MAG TPA: TM0106 family RecB-like putative nuclease [Candidatus Paceibacterota bacterium]|nr:TM0106 family RecB-like putative nuclease [Candidatus Paceibacterota bacterium]
MPDNSQPLLYGEYFYKFFQCPHWIWYDIYADATQKKEIPPLLELIHKGKMVGEEGLSHHKQFEQVQPEMMRDLDEAFLATLELMKQGKNIYHGVLMSENWVGMPDFLEARPGKSWLGDHYYVVYDAQHSLDLRDEYKFQLIFYSLILERLQGVRPKEAYVIDPQGNERSFLISDFIDQFHLTRLQIEKILNGEKPAPFLKSGCKRTPWYSLCLADAQDCADVSLIYRISQADQRRLYDIGIKTVDDLATADINHIQQELEDWPFDKIIRFSNQAKALVTNKPIVLRKPLLPKVRYEVYFDIESDPLSDIDYLLGVLTRDTQTGEAKYQSFLAQDKDHEPEIWARFLDYLAGLEDFVIYHYAFYEKQVFERLALRYGAPAALVDKFKDNTIDLHLELVDSAVLPIYFYSLKDVGSFLGYHWNAPDAGGAESVLWYQDWLQKKDQAIMDKILRYNEDDVRATMAVKDWLDTQKPSKQKEKLDE